MATKKQRRRREKGKRHDYMWIDDEGNEVDVDPAASDKDKGGQAPGRFQRDPQAPSWQRTFRRGAIFAPIMFGTVLLLSPNVPMAQKLTQTLLIVAIFIPFSYFIDRLFYRSHLKRRARTEPPASRRRGS